jgi:hypothetical protein
MYIVDMNGENPSGCMCELCHPNWYMGRDGDFVPEQPETCPMPMTAEDKEDEIQRRHTKRQQLQLAAA